MTSEYIIHAKVKNNLILSRIMAAGYRSVADFCKKNNLEQVGIGQLINMKIPAKNKKDGWRAEPLRLADALDVDVEVLFSEEQRTVELKIGRASCRERV